MSAAALLIQFLFAFIDFALSMQGVFALLLGIVTFLALPIVPKATGQFKKFAHLHLWLATSLLSRAAIVVTEHGDLLLKRMSFDDLGVEKISFDDLEKDFEDPADALHHWMGIPFALADEKHGVLFDPRHAALGTRKREAEERDTKEYRATQEEYESYDVQAWKRAVAEFPKNTYELVNLGNVRQLIDGGERAEYAERVESFYEHSRAPFQSGTSTVRVMMIVLALVAPFGVMWFAATQGSTAGGNGTTVGYPSLGMLSILAGLEGARDELSDRLGNVEWKRGLTAVGVLLSLPVGFLAMFLVAGPLTAIFVFVLLGIGFWAVPFLTIFARMSTFLSEGMARQLFKLGMLGYDRPVFTWTNRKYELREGSQMNTSDVTWYGLMGALVGFTFDPVPESWGTAKESRSDLEAQKEHTGDAMADGGGMPATNLPDKFVRTPTNRRASIYAGFIPKRLRRDRYYVSTGIAWGAFSNSATGEKSMNRLTYAKDEHGGSDGMDEASLIKWVVGCGIISFATGLWVFFL